MGTDTSLLSKAEPPGHFVQLYRTDEAVLAGNVGVYIAEGLKSGNAGVMIATAPHREMVISRLGRMGAEPGTAAAEGRLVPIDTREIINRLLVDGKPDRQVFESAIAKLLSELASKFGSVRVYGEIVGVLWQQKQYEAAALLEELWNELLASRTFSLFCGYPIDVFGPDFRAAKMERVLCAHTHLIPAGPNGDIEAALDRAIYEVFGPESQSVRQKINARAQPSWAQLPSAESVLLFLKDNLPVDAHKLLDRARCYYHASQLLPPGIPPGGIQN
jgi:hypothetical protein